MPPGNPLALTRRAGAVDGAPAPQVWARIQREPPLIRRVAQLEDGGPARDRRNVAGQPQGNELLFEATINDLTPYAAPTESPHLDAVVRQHCAAHKEGKRHEA
jgi:hypothetical protein